jgi:hypothetical protein
MFLRFDVMVCLLVVIPAELGPNPSRTEEQTINPVKSALSALLIALAIAVTSGVVQANADSTPMESNSRHWAN